MNNQLKIIFIASTVFFLTHALTPDQEAFIQALRTKPAVEVMPLFNKPGFDANFPEAQALFGEFISGRNIMAKIFVEELIDHGMNVNFILENGSTPLIVAASQGDYAIVDRLLKHGARIDAQDNQGMTALMAAIGAKSEKSSMGDPRDPKHFRDLDTLITVRKLVEAGANQSLSDKSGKTAHDYALRKPQFAAILNQSKNGGNIEALLNQPETINYLKSDSGDAYLKRIGVR
jgi:ankyrin repeat protein